MTDIPELIKRLRDADISGHGEYSALVREAAAALERAYAEPTIEEGADAARAVHLGSTYNAALRAFLARRRDGPPTPSHPQPSVSPDDA